MKMHVKTGDEVMVLSGKEKGKIGKILSVDNKNGKVIIEGVNVAKKHTKPRRQGDRGGILDKEIPMYACKVMRVCPSCNKASRVGVRFLENGGKEKFCKKCDSSLKN